MGVHDGAGVKVPTYWNYRVLFRPDAEESYYTIVEAYYEGDEVVPSSWIDSDATVVGGSVEGLRGALQGMLAALDKPVLMVEGDGLREFRRRR